MRARTFLTALLLTAAAFSAAADPVKFSGSVRARVENWSFFDAGTNAAGVEYDDEYTFLGAILRGSVAQKVDDNLDWQVELAAPVLVNLPENAVGAGALGQLGLGGSYWAANREQNDVSLFAKQAFARYKWGGNMIRAGRMEFAEGTEVAPKNAVLAGLKASRVSQRLIGPFGFSHVGRSFDGVHYANTTGAFNFTAAALRPTVGAFKVDGMEEIDDVQFLYGAVTYSRPNADERLFVMAYDDDRGVLKTDNRPVAVRNGDREDIRVITIGGHYLAQFGNFDVVLWTAWQTGDWGVQDHSAAAVDIEGGYHFAGATKPTLRAGYFRSSGDDDPADGEHGTFFQHLPTPRIHARFPFYNSMNSTDAFVQFSMKPTAKLTLSSEAHLLALTEETDLWYAGGGAFEEATFGFAGRPANGNDDLATVIDLGLDYAIDAKTSASAYVGLAEGGDVVDAIFADNGARYVYFEVTRRF
jgi:hypothetical protein